MAISRADLFRGRLRSEPGPSEAPRGVEARIGAACLSYTGTDCRMCGDHCDRGAIRFRPLGRGRWLPIIEEGQCNGCGDCAAVCPVKAVSMEVAAA